METFERSEMTTLVSCVNTLTKRGYTENFVAKKKGLEAPSNKKIYTPADVKITNFYRFEGDSDPADNAICYAIETNDGLKGMLIDSYGTQTNQKVSKFIADVEEMEKTKTQKS